MGSVARGQLIERGRGIWLVRIFLGRDTTGKKQFHNKTIHGTKKEAQQYATKKLRELDTGTYSDPCHEALEHLLGRWLEGKRRAGIAPRTLLDYRNVIARYIAPELGHAGLSGVTATRIQQFYDDLGDRGLSPTVVRHCHAILRQVLQKAVKDRLIPSNPASDVDLPALKREKMRALTATQATQFLAAAETDRLHALWTVLLDAGLRPAEAFALAWDDYDGKALHVQRSLVRLTGVAWSLEPTKTREANRRIDLAAGTIRALSAHRARQAEERLRAGDQYAPHGLIFGTSSSEPLQHSNVVRRHFQQILKKAGLPSIRLYDLRHTCATLLLAAGEPVNAVAERLGHADPTMVLKVYAHVLPGAQRALASRMQDLLYG